MKKIILIGPQDWFVDSFLYFIEKGFKGTVIKLSTFSNAYNYNYTILHQLGYEVLEVKDLDISKLNLDENTLVISGPNFSGDIKSLLYLQNYTIEMLELTYEISKYNRDNKCGAKVVRWFNGDTGFGSQEIVDYFNEKIQYVDALIFDNSLLEEFVLKNIPNASNIPRYVSWIETPLERFVKNNINTNIKKEFISTGRLITSTRTPVKYISYNFANPQISRNNDKIILGSQSNRIYTIIYIFGIKLTLKKKLKMTFNLAGGIDDINIIYNDRNNFYNKHSEISFGISHMYDIFNNSLNNFLKNKDFYFSIYGQHLTNNVGSGKELYYTFCNVPSKDLTYLMNGIIPIIPHNIHNVYKELVEKKMAILVKEKYDMKKLYDMDIDEILEYRTNIYNNREFFTFEKSGKLLLSILN